MKFKSQNINIKTGDINICLMHIDDVKHLDIWPGDRISIKKGKNKVTAVIDTTRQDSIIRRGVIGLFKEVGDSLGTAEHDTIDIKIERKPASVWAIQKKLQGKPLQKKEIMYIVQDIVAKRLTNIEVTYFVSACYVYDLTFQETKYFTEAMVATGNRLKPNKKNVYDKHSSGGVPGNRTTPLIVAICSAAGLFMPKTSSRSITSPAGTADTMEVLTNVDLTLSEMKKVLKKCGACMAWGGSLNLAPADDDLIRIERPLSIDSEGQMIASILAKKLAVSANHILIELAVSPEGKIKKKDAVRIKKKLLKLARSFQVKMIVQLNKGDEPIGHGIGPALEARDVLWVLKGDQRAPEDLRQKGLYMATELLKMGNVRNAAKKALRLLESGKAFEAFKKILKAQGLKTDDPEEILIGPYSFHIKSKKNGKIKTISNKLISRIAKAAGSPADKSAGIYLYKHVEDSVKKNELLYTIYAYSERKLDYARSIVDGAVIVK